MYSETQLLGPYICAGETENLSSSWRNVLSASSCEIMPLHVIAHSICKAVNLDCISDVRFDSASTTVSATDAADANLVGHCKR